ncbi:hypothetical protein RRG08_009843 [Elysia crispata]|uniref:Uncharacterized protein n=1 Tax=Elysia crispata TaxID=231223 RepID=A0AAE0Z4A7_9GAST|nr:hypothetical protein RRG08_009843 [Elysia crispata]
MYVLGCYIYSYSPEVQNEPASAFSSKRPDHDLEVTGRTSSKDFGPRYNRNKNFFKSIVKPARKMGDRCACLEGTNAK